MGLAAAFAPVDDLWMVEEEAAAHLGALVGGTDLMDEPTEQQWQVAEADPREDVGGARTFVDPQGGGVDEPDGQAVQNAAEVFVGVGDVADVALPVGQ